MRHINKSILFLSTAVLVIVCGIALPLENPVGSGRYPASVGASGLKKSPNPIDTTINQVVTGNVAGGKHFRGIVPYRSRYTVGSSSASSTIDDFLRYSAPAGNSGQYRGFYSGTTTVSRINPGTNTVTSAGSPGGNSGIQAPQMFGSYLPRASSIGRRNTVLQAISSEIDLWQPVSYGENRPLSLDPEQLEELILSDIELDRKQLRRKMFLDQENERDAPNTDIADPEAVKKQLTGDTEEKEGKQDRATIDHLELLKRPLDPAYKEKEDASQQDPSGKDSFDSDQFGVPGFDKKSGRETSKKRSVKRNSDLFDSASRTRADAVRAKYGNYAAYSSDMFRRHMESGRRHLLEGEYYKAADSYSMASIYESDSYQAYAGKAHALFAAGEYMSSSLFTVRAIESNPEYLKEEVDLKAVIADRDKIDDRLLDLEKIIKGSSREIVEFNFLLAYVYYRMDRPENALENINTASEGMKDIRAAELLEEAINADQP